MNIKQSAANEAVATLPIATGHSFTAVNQNGKWYPIKIDLGTGDSVQLLFGFHLEDDAIEYAIDNF